MAQDFSTPALPDISITGSYVTLEQFTVSFTTVDEYAGDRRCDPWIEPGNAVSDHHHTWLGTRLSPTADIDHLWREPFDPQPGSNADMARAIKPGSTGTFIYKDGTRGGLLPGIWWTKLWDISTGKTPKPCGEVGGPARYYIRHKNHQGAQVQPMPVGLRFITQHNNQLHPPAGIWQNQSQGTFIIHPEGPDHWDGVNVDTPNHADHVSYGKTAKCPVPIPVIQPQLKFRLGYMDDLTTPLADRIRFGTPGQWQHGFHMDYIFSERPVGIMAHMLTLTINAKPGRKIEATRIKSISGVAPPDEVTPPPQPVVYNQNIQVSAGNQQAQVTTKVTVT